MWRQKVGVITATLSSLCLGYQISAIDAPSFIFQQCQPLESFSLLKPCIKVSLWEWASIVAIFCIGALFGSLFGGLLNQRLGRKTSMAISIFSFILGMTCISTANFFSMLLVGRFIVGVAGGLSTVTVPMYLAEIAPSAAMKGTLATLHQLALVLGILLAQITGLFLSSHWRILFALPLAANIIQVILMFFVVESPDYYDCRSDHEMALKSRFMLFGKNHVKQEHKEENTISLWSLLRIKEARKSLLIACSLHFFQPASGINGLFYFSTFLFKDISHLLSPSLIAISIGVTNLLSTIISVRLIDRVGRRILLISSSSMICTSAIGLCLSFYYNFLPGRIGFVLLYMIGFAIGLGTVPWIVISDIFPSSAIPAAFCLATFINWLTNFAVGLLFEPMALQLQSLTFIPFAALMLVLFLTSIFYITESKDRKGNYL